MGRTDLDVTLQCDDTLFIGTQDLMNYEDAAASEFKWKQRKAFSVKLQAFYGIKLCKEDDGSIAATQKEKIEKSVIRRTQKGSSR